MSAFSSIPKADYLFESESFFVIKDKFPVSPGHALIISKREVSDFFTLSSLEKKELMEVVGALKEILQAELNPDGYNIGMNCGEVAGQTVMHFHCHLIPRFMGDMDDPRGGVRHAVKGKGYY